MSLEKILSFAYVNFFTFPHLSANVIPCLKCLATALATDNKRVLKFCRLGGGGGGEETDLWGGDAGWMSRAYRHIKCLMRHCNL